MKHLMRLLPLTSLPLGDLPLGDLPLRDLNMSLHLDSAYLYLVLLLQRRSHLSLALCSPTLAVTPPSN